MMRESTVLPRARGMASMMPFMMPFMASMMTSALGMTFPVLVMPLRVLAMMRSAIVTPAFMVARTPAMFRLPCPMLTVTPRAAVAVVVLVGKQGDDAHPGRNGLLHGPRDGTGGRCRRCG